MYVWSIKTSSLFGNVPVAAWTLYDGSWGNKLYLYPNSLLSDNVLYGYNSDIVGFN